MNDSDHAAAERRIESFVIGSGVAIAIAAALGWGFRAAESAALGAALSWLNFRWLRHGAAGVMRLGLAQAGAQVVRVPRTIHAKFIGRIALLVLAVCAILIWMRLPAVALLCGLSAVFPAILLELGYELMHGAHRSGA